MEVRANLQVIGDAVQAHTASATRADLDDAVRRASSAAESHVSNSVASDDFDNTLVLPHLLTSSPASLPRGLPPDLLTCLPPSRTAHCTCVR